MSVTDRQNNLLVAQDWQKIYTSFQQADFKSYDFETIRRTMIAYLRENYPEDFNDYVESSEYIALIDLIAYIAESFSFRVDLNARENFLETAARRNSILRLARLINYNPKRNQPATGLLKIVSVATTQTVTDSTGTVISSNTILWNDPNNPNYRQNFIDILNAANVSGQNYGKPRESKSIGGIDTEIYTINSSNIDVPIYTFNKTISGLALNFEIVPASVNNSDSIYELNPIPGTGFTYLYRNDGAGDSSPNAGFFVLFKQGSSSSFNFNIAQPVANYVQPVNVNNINNSDVWLYQLNDFGQLQTYWTQVSSIVGNNVIYNSNNANNRTLYEVVTQDNDAVNLVFGDGTFANIPSGSFRLYLRTSANTNFSIKPTDLQGITISIPYTDINGAAQTLTITGSLQQSVYNAAASESNNSIVTNAPQTYYSQNRMITGEDYNIVPLSASQNIIKVKALNRIASGISRQKELLDPSGAYSNVSVFADDGIIYREESAPQFTFTFVNNNEITERISQTEELLTEAYSRQFYYLKYGQKDLSAVEANWISSTVGTNTNTGYFNASGPIAVGATSTNDFKYVLPGSLIKFTSPTPNTTKFLNNVFVPASTQLAQDRLWVAVGNIVGDGSNSGLGNLASGLGPVTLSGAVPTGALATAVYAPFPTVFDATLITKMQTLIANYQNFGVRFDFSSGTWQIISAANLNTTTEFSLTHAGDTTATNQDASWWFKFTSDQTIYTVTYRALDYIFQSVEQNVFHYDSADKVYDYVSGTSVKDSVKILKGNTVPSTGFPIGYPITWQVVDTITEPDGYQDNRAVKVAFYDSKDNGVADNPEIFDIVVEPTVDVATKYVFFQQYLSYDNIVRYQPTDATQFIVADQPSSVTLPSTYKDGQLFYFYLTDEVQVYDAGTITLTTTTAYYARVGRSAIEFMYNHNAGQTVRIDPAQTNIVDLYILERPYDQAFRTWLSQGGTEPTAATSDQLRISYAGSLNPLKGLSDQIIYHPVSYKILFGHNADQNLQATFKVVKNLNTNVTDAIIKTGVIQAINQFFALDNWNFGDTFYFTELAAYIHQQLAPNLLSVVIVPNQTAQGFGSLFQISSAADEIFISGATVDNVVIIDAIGANQLAASGNVVTSTTNITNNTRSTSAVSSVTSRLSGSGPNIGSSGTGY